MVSTQDTGDLEASLRIEAFVLSHSPRQESSCTREGRGFVRLRHCIAQKLLCHVGRAGLKGHSTATTLVVADLQSSNSQGPAYPVQISPSLAMPSSIALISRTHLSHLRGASRRMDIRSARCNEWKRERPRLAMHECLGESNAFGDGLTHCDPQPRMTSPSPYPLQFPFCIQTPYLSDPRYNIRPTDFVYRTAYITEASTQKPLP